MNNDEVNASIDEVRKQMLIVEKKMIEKDAERVELLKVWKDSAMVIQEKNNQLNEDLNVWRALKKLTEAEREKMLAVFLKK